MTNVRKAKLLLQGCECKNCFYFQQAIVVFNFFSSDIEEYNQILRKKKTHCGISEINGKRYLSRIGLCHAWKKRLK
jgi:hypothetical protein